jgi:hypothetical protein
MALALQDLIASPDQQTGFATSAPPVGWQVDPADSKVLEAHVTAS